MTHLLLHLSWVSVIMPFRFSPLLQAKHQLYYSSRSPRSFLSSRCFYCYWSFGFPPIAVETRHQISSGNSESLVRINKPSEECEGCSLSPLCSTDYMKTKNRELRNVHFLPKLLWREAQLRPELCVHLKEVSLIVKRHFSTWGWIACRLPAVRSHQISSVIRDLTKLSLYEWQTRDRFHFKNVMKGKKQLQYIRLHWI